MTLGVIDPAVQHIGRVVAVRASVVDVRFDTMLPPIHTVLKADDGRIELEVLAQRDAQHLRSIAGSVALSAGT
jgi:F-type H+-transporting ATPase subunit beta